MPNPLKHVRYERCLTLPRTNDSATEGQPRVDGRTASDPVRKELRSVTGTQYGEFADCITMMTRIFRTPSVALVSTATAAKPPHPPLWGRQSHAGDPP